MERDEGGGWLPGEVRRGELHILTKTQTGKFRMEIAGRGESEVNGVEPGLVRALLVQETQLETKQTTQTVGLYTVEPSQRYRSDIKIIFTSTFR